MALETEASPAVLGPTAEDSGSSEPCMLSASCLRGETAVTRMGIQSRQCSNENGPSSEQIGIVQQFAQFCFAGSKLCEWLLTGNASDPLGGATRQGTGHNRKHLGSHLWLALSPCKMGITVSEGFL